MGICLLLNDNQTFIIVVVVVVILLTFVKENLYFQVKLGLGRQEPEAETGYHTDPESHGSPNLENTDEMLTLLNPLDKPAPRSQRWPEHAHCVRNSLPLSGKPGPLLQRKQKS